MDPIETVKNILKEKVDISKINEDNDLTDLGLDSLDLVEMMIRIEDQLGIELTSEEMMKVSTVKDMVDIINKKSK